jgi:hypothetical protein
MTAMTNSDSPSPGVLAIAGALTGAVVALVVLVVLDVPVSLSVVAVGLLAVAAATAVALLLAGPAPVDGPGRPGDPRPSWEAGSVPPSEQVPPRPADRPVQFSPPTPPPSPPQPSLPSSPTPALPWTPPTPNYQIDTLESGNGVGGPGGSPTPWWNKGRPSGAPGGADAPAAPAPPPPELGSYLGDAVIAQCPNCGEFRVDKKRTGDCYTFDCPSCQMRWTWRPGEDWRSIEVAPRRRHSRRPADI